MAIYCDILLSATAIYTNARTIAGDLHYNYRTIESDFGLMAVEHHFGMLTHDLVIAVADLFTKIHVGMVDLVSRVKNN